MSNETIEVDIDHGKIVAREPHRLPDVAHGLLTIVEEPTALPKKRDRIRLPIIQGDGSRIVNLTSKEIDAILWGE